MSGNVAQKAAVLLIAFSLFPSCGDLETMFPSNGNYQVRTMVNGNSLDDCSLIRSNDKIRPYFTVSVVDDPDLIGMLVYLQNSKGDIIGEKVRYILDIYADETLQAETEAPEDAEFNEANEETDKINEEVFDEESEDTSEAAGLTARDLSEIGSVKERWGFADAGTIIKNADVNVEIAVKSLDQELPYFPLPKKLEIGAYTLVFEALGKREILSRTETNIFYLGNAQFSLKDISMYLPGLSNSQLIAPGMTVMLEARLDYDIRLDPYVIWYNGKYVISEGKISEGAGSILWEAPEQAGFYSLRVETFPFQFKRNLSGLIREITLPVSPKTASLGYFFQSASQLAGRSPVAAGTVYPEQVQLINAMIAAIEAGEAADTTEEKNIPSMPLPPELLRWYQFEGNLRDTMSVLPNELSLMPLAEKAVHWAAVGQSYGLSIESEDAYQISPINFFRGEQDQGGGIFLLHIKAPTEGAVFSAFFPLWSSSTDGVWMDIVKEKNIIALRLNTGSTFVELPLYLAAIESQSFIPIVVEFYIRPYRLEAKISLCGEYPQAKIESICLPGALSGEGMIRLGTQYQNNTAQRGVNTENSDETETAMIVTDANPPADTAESQAADIQTDSPEESTDIPAEFETFISEALVQHNTIWNELAILYSSIPLLEEEITAVDISGEQDAVGPDEAAKEYHIDKIIDTKEPKAESFDNSPLLKVLKEETLTYDFSLESDSAEMNDTETENVGEDENPVFSAIDANTDTDDSLQEPENPAALPEKI